MTYDAWKAFDPNDLDTRPDDDYTIEDHAEAVFRLAHELLEPEAVEYWTDRYETVGTDEEKGHVLAAMRAEIRAVPVEEKEGRGLAGLVNDLLRAVGEAQK